MAADNQELSPKARLLIALACVAAGVIPVLAAFDASGRATKLSSHE